MKTEDVLTKETEKWKGKLENELNNLKPTGTKGREFLENINAYNSDSDHFRSNGDLVRAFESIVWAWAWLEIGLELDFFKK